jgi:1-phosphatidylinositol-4-phosphate 5-kinase
VFPAHRDIHQTYDLKESTIGREFDEAKLKYNPKGSLKDLNWIHRGMSMQFGPRKKDLLMSQIKKDVELLASLNIMDYSLLIGIHDLARGNSENIRGTTLSVYQPRALLQRSLFRKGKYGHPEPPLKRLATNLSNKEFLERKLGFFTSEDGGLFATNSNDEPTGDYIYYFGVIDLLTTVHLIQT